MPHSSFVLFALGPVQGFIKASRTVRDLWSGSYLLSYLTFRAMKAVADGAGERAIVFPNYAELPLARWARGTRAPLTVLEPCIPNRFLAEVPDDMNPVGLAQAAEKACWAAWAEIAEDVRKFLYGQTPHESLSGDERGLWRQQIDSFFEIYTAVLPQNEYPEQRLSALLGPPGKDEPNDLWPRRHQVAQKMLAAVKNRRHFPVYAPVFGSDMVPQKDTLLGTLEHVGPGNREESRAFWKDTATEWLAHGSKVTAAERLCAVSLVKRFAWAHHFAKVFGYEDRRVRKYDDTATVAAAKWLADERAPDPRKLVQRHELWSGQWLYWETPVPPKNPDNRDGTPDDDPVPPNVWRAIRAKRDAQGKPPTYYAVFVFDGDKMGGRFNAAKDAPAYQRISGTLGNFALTLIRGIVERHYGQLIYAGGDDALCVLPTETALACAKEIDQQFRDNWQKGLPDDEPATISGGLVVAHYKDDLRFVMNQARAAEKKAKDAGRNALQITVCRRSGEHSSAFVPWDFLSTVIGWVNGFLAKASDRWAYKLRADLPVIEQDPQMFKLELGRQLNRAEEDTKKLLSANQLLGHFDSYRDQLLDPHRQNERHEQGKPPATEKDAITDFVTLLQTASFLARGRDE